jgi:hypothetical protein
MPAPAAVPGGQAQAGNGPPFGAANATGPTPNAGYEAAGLQRLGLVVKQLEQLIPLFGAASDQGKDVLKALQILLKSVPSGSVTPASERNDLQRQVTQNAQQNQQLAALRQRQMGGAGQPAAAA